MSEIWKSVPMLLGVYEASSLGRVRRAVTSKGARAGRVLRVQEQNGGYLMVNPCIHGVHCYCTVHSLVADAFLGPRPAGHHVDHVDCDKKNNAVTNLQYVTPQENDRRARAAGLRPTSPYPASAVRRGDRSNFSRINDAQASEIVRRKAAGERSAALAAVFGISESQVNRVVGGTSRSHLRSLTQMDGSPVRARSEQAEHQPAATPPGV